MSYMLSSYSDLNRVFIPKLKAKSKLEKNSPIKTSPRITAGIQSFKKKLFQFRIKTDRRDSYIKPMHSTKYIKSFNNLALINKRKPNFLQINKVKTSSSQIRRKNSEKNLDCNTLSTNRLFLPVFNQNNSKKSRNSITEAKYSNKDTLSEVQSLRKSIFFKKKEKHNEKSLISSLSSTSFIEIPPRYE